ncbi:uncharacterized protein TRIREDRAFT_123095 [Trichoderma reesei QM6a]|uniref:Predicted protein n=2 Tax=Hypocrea jecorina TaxID=51453 RepID=G0RQU5_HYPJQ|nr:uncharacterized protein TRIREDRAFT_123095 [Trichoderma reesei QM6a]EGR46321.1 predicted protein [Trichoderma reesei QM6a]ETR99580.1 hypothetical protein M419DRAFT_138427 [Trichoderma reesei RUT C-30]
MPSLTLPTSASTETLLLKCQKETHKSPLPPTWTSHPPNQEIHPPPNTLALAIRIDAAFPTSIRFYESATNRPVGAVGPEFRGSLVLVPWRPGLKFVVAPSCRRSNGCLVGVIREQGKGGTPRGDTTTTPGETSPRMGPSRGAATPVETSPQVVLDGASEEPPQVTSKEPLREHPQAVPKKIPKQTPQAVPEISPMPSPGINPKPTPTSIPKITANMKAKITPKTSPKAPTTMKTTGIRGRSNSKRKSLIPVAIPKKSSTSSGSDGKAALNGQEEGGGEERPPRHGTAIPSPVSSSGSRKRKHVSFDDAIVTGKRSIRMAVPGH